MANPTTNLGMTKPTVGGSTDTWGTTLNEDVIDTIDAVFGSAGTDVSMAEVSVDQLTIIAQGDLRLADTTGGEYIAFQAAGTTTSYTLTMPGTVGASGQALRASDGAGVLEWYTPADVGDITAIVAGAGMTGTSLSGPIPTLNVIGTSGTITVSADAVTIASDYVGQTSITTLGTIATGTWEGTTVAVDQGGTGATSLTDGGVLLGSGTGAITATSVLGDGEILIGDASGDPATLDVGSSTAITILGTVATGVWQGTAVANAYLANSTVSYGGVSLALGASDGTPAFNLSSATAYTGDSSLVTVGTVASGTWNGTAVGVAYGGTAISSYAAGDILYASGSTTLAKLAKGSDADVLTLASGVPSWAAPTTGDITGVTAGTGLSGGGTSGTVTLNVEAAQTQITSVGALAAGSISSGFGAIDVGSSSIDGGTITGTFAGNLTGNVTGNCSGTAGSATGNAATATALATARAINGTDFDGTAAITVTAAAGTVTGATLNSGVTASSLTSLGTLTSVGVTGVSTLGARIDHYTGGTGGTLAAQYGSGDDIGLSGSVAAADFNIKCVGEFAVSAGASGTTVFRLEGTAASLAGALAVTGDVTAAAASFTGDVTISDDVIIGTNPSSAGDIRLNKNFGIFTRNNANDANKLVISENIVTGNDTLDFGDNGKWAALRFHAGASNVMELTSSAINLNKAVTTTGAATVGGNLVVSGTGPHAIGAAADGAIAFRVGGSYTSDGTDTIAIGAMFGQYITAVSGDTAYQSGVFFDSQIITQGGSDPIVVVSQVRIAEPNIQKNTSGDIAIAASVYIHATPSEGLVNAALYVKAGNIIHADMATSDPSVAGAFWNDSGTVKISAG